MVKQLVLVILVIGGLVACGKEDPYETERVARDKYLADNNITVEPTSSGLYYVEILKGTGPAADPGDQVRVRYKGMFLDGTQFDAGIFEFILGLHQVISGWDEGINYMNEGGKARLIIPSDLAYGPYGYGSIPGYSTLVFDVELISVN
jgi:FKBP-type peptidyl-prolyl cis-trans isomerase FkpA